MTLEQQAQKSTDERIFRARSIIQNEAQSHAFAETGSAFR